MNINMCGVIRGQSLLTSNTIQGGALLEGGSYRRARLLE